jgi:23S rRNA pseudouridine2605 synthase
MIPRVEERLQKILSRAGVASRRAAETLLAEGRITVNGAVVTEPGTRADVERDDVRVDGVRVRAPERPVYIALNKPKGVVSTRRDPGRRPTVMDLVPPIRGLFPIGRLDVTTEGLILLTNDGAFAERVAHPRYEVARVYLAKVHGIPEPATLERMRRGVTVEGDRLAADRVRILKAEGNAWLEVTLHEGRHHEVRRLMQAVGHPVSKLKRLAIGPVTVRGLDLGAYRPLTVAEVAGLLRGEAPPDLALPKKIARPPGLRAGRGREGGARTDARRPPPRGAGPRPERALRPRPRWNGERDEGATDARRGGRRAAPAGAAVRGAQWRGMRAGSRSERAHLPADAKAGRTQSGHRSLPPPKGRSAGQAIGARRGPRRGRGQR